MKIGKLNISKKNLIIIGVVVLVVIVVDHTRAKMCPLNFSYLLQTRGTPNIT